MLARKCGSALRLLRHLSKHNKNWHMALAIAVGVVAGLVPKTNLLAVAIFALVLVLPIHTLLAIGVSVVVSALADQLDPWSHRLGMWLLEHSKVEAFWRLMDSIPMVPWFSLYNSVVLGSLIIGLAAAYPVFVVSYFFLKWMDSASKPAKDSPGRTSEMILPTSERLGAPNRVEDSEPIDPATLLLVPHWHMHSPHSSRTNVQLAHEPRAARVLEASRESARQVPDASELANCADEALQACLAEESVGWRESETHLSVPQSLQTTTSTYPNAGPIAGYGSLAPAADPTAIPLGTDSMRQLASAMHSTTPVDTKAETVHADGDERWLIETTIEMVRLAEEVVARKRVEQQPLGRDSIGLEPGKQDSSLESVSRSAQPSSEIRAPAVMQLQSLSMHASPSRGKSEEEQGGAKIERASWTDDKRTNWTEKSSCSSDSASTTRGWGMVEENSSDNREEALRYLLRHLRDVKERE